MTARCAPRSLTFLLARRSRARAGGRPGGVHRRPGRAPRAARDGDRDSAAGRRRAARATGGDSTADRNCPARSDSHALPDCRTVTLDSPRRPPTATPIGDGHSRRRRPSAYDNASTRRVPRRPGRHRQLRPSATTASTRPGDERRHDLRATPCCTDGVGDARQREAIVDGASWCGASTDERRGRRMSSEWYARRMTVGRGYSVYGDA